VFAPLDPDHMPIPIIMVSRSGTVTANHAFEDLHGRHEVTRQLHRRIDVATWAGRVFDLCDLPWERVLRQDFVEEEIWYDRVTSSRLRYCVRGRSFAQGGLLALEDLTSHASGALEFVDAAARAADEATLELTGVTLARGVHCLTGADAVFVFERQGDRVVPLASSRSDIAPAAVESVVAAATDHGAHMIDVTDGSRAAAALGAVGLRSLVAVPLIVDGDRIGSLAVAWRQACTIGSLERRTLDAAGNACAAALVRRRQRDRLEPPVLGALRAAALSITELSSQHGVLERLADQACALVGANHAAIGVLEPGRLELADIAVTVKAAPLVGPADVRQLLEELANDDRATCRRKPSADDELAPASCVGARLAIDGQHIGSVCAFDKRDGTPFTTADERALELFGAQAALAISYSRQLQRAEEAQRRLASLHDELSAVIAHDMRSPISSMLLQIDLLMESGALEGDQKSVPTAAIDRLRRSAQRLSRMAEDLLDASRIELGRVALERRYVSLRDAIGNLVAQLEPTFDGRPIEIDADLDAPLVFADPMRLDEIVTNLLENAAKYSQPGRPIKVRIARDGGGATVSVQDEGSGIAADAIPKLFDRFFQAKRLRSKKAGLGLGLYITKGLVEAHGGRIWVDSALGQGSQFHVWLPSGDQADAA